MVFFKTGVASRATRLQLKKPGVASRATPPREKLLALGIKLTMQKAPPFSRHASISDEDLNAALFLSFNDTGLLCQTPADEDVIFIDEE